MKSHKPRGLAWGLLWTIVLLASTAGPRAAAQPASVGKPRETGESLKAWQWLQELPKPAAAKARYGECLLPPSVLDKARLDLADLRLRDTRGREVPFALRVRYPKNVLQALTHTAINRGKVPEDGSITLTLDLGDGRTEHNTVEIVTTGTDFRRRVRVEGSDSPDKDWIVLLDRALLMHGQVGTQMIDLQRVTYAASRFRYLRLRVFPDRNLDTDNPEIASVTVLWFTQLPGLDVTLPAQAGAREDVRVDGHPCSAWAVEFGGLTVPCGQLSFDVADDSFVRAYRVEVISPHEPNRIVAHGEWRRRGGEEKRPLEIRLDQEVTAQRLRLVVTDDRNPPLTVTAVRYGAAARQLLFEFSDELAWPLQLYFGNPHAQAGNYELARFLPETLAPARVEWASGGILANAGYEPEPKPWTERWPWLVYVVLGAASLVLLVILAILARTTLSRNDAQPARV
jgi:hypothetical protein